MLPDPAVFLYSYIRKVAVLSSQIEGAQSSLSDLLLFENEAALKLLNEGMEPPKQARPAAPMLLAIHGNGSLAESAAAARYGAMRTRKKKRLVALTLLRGR